MEKVVQGRIDYEAKGVNCKTTFLIYEMWTRIYWGATTSATNFVFESCFRKHGGKSKRSRRISGPDLGESVGKILKIDLSPKGRLVIKKAIKKLTREALNKGAASGSKAKQCRLFLNKRCGER